jgi:MYXO-CTERM domain-containing protein
VACWAFTVTDFHLQLSAGFAGAQETIMKWSVIAVALATTAAGPLCWTSQALAQEAGIEAGVDSGMEASTAVDAAGEAAADGGGTSEAGASVCMVDKDCPGGGGNVCGGDVCSWCNTSMPGCKPPGGATSGVMCVPAASLDPGHCLADTDCKCNADAGMSAICCKPGSSFCIAHTCVYHNKLYTMPSDAGTPSSADAATGDDGGGSVIASSSSSSSGSGGGSSDNGGGGCNVSPASSSAFVFGAAAAMLGLAFGLRRRR